MKTIYKPTRRGVFAKRQTDLTYQIAMTMTGHTVTVITANPNMTNEQITRAAMEWYPNATRVVIDDVCCGLERRTVIQIER